MMIRKLFQGWSINFVWEWPWFFGSKLKRSEMVYFTPCHIGFEAGTYIGSYIELTVVILGVGFYVKWYPPTEGKEEFLGEMREAMSSVRKQIDMEEEAT